MSQAANPSASLADELTGLDLRGVFVASVPLIGEDEIIHDVQH
jgi:hypothetical protein